MDPPNEVRHTQRRRPQSSNPKTRAQPRDDGSETTSGSVANAAHKRPPRPRSKSDAAMVSHLLRHLPQSVRPQLEGTRPLTKPHASERLMKPIARGKAIERSRDLEHYVAELERRKRQATHMRDSYSTLEKVQELTGQERVKNRLLLQESTKIRKDSELEQGRLDLLAGDAKPAGKRASRSTLIGASKVQEDIDELETKIVIKARVVENLTLLLAQKRVDLQEAKKSTKSQAEAQKEFLTAHKLTKVAIHNLKSKLEQAFSKFHGIVQENKQLREQVDFARSERIKFDKTYTRLGKSLQATFHAKRHATNELKRAEARTAAVRQEVEELKEEAATSQQEFINARDGILQDMQDNPVPTVMPAGMLDHVVQGATLSAGNAHYGSRRARQRRRSSLASEMWWQTLEQARMKQVVEDTEKQFEEFDKVFTEMKESQGTDDLDAVVNNFIESDLKCFSLMETVQQLSLQVSKEQDELKAVQAELLSFNEQPQVQEARARRKMKADLLDKKKAIDAQSSHFAEKYESTVAVIRRVGAQAGGVLEAFGVPAKHFEEVDESNIMEYLSVLEQTLVSNLELNKSTPVLAAPKRAPTPQPPTESSGDKFRRVGAGIGSALSAKREAQELATDDAQPTVLDEVSEGVGATIMKFVGILKNKRESGEAFRQRLQGKFGGMTTTRLTLREQMLKAQHHKEQEDDGPMSDVGVRAPATKQPNLDLASLDTAEEQFHDLDEDSDEAEAEAPLGMDELLADAMNRLSTRGVSPTRYRPRASYNASLVQAQSTLEASTWTLSHDSVSTRGRSDQPVTARLSKEAAAIAESETAMLTDLLETTAAHRRAKQRHAKASGSSTGGDESLQELRSGTLTASREDESPVNSTLSSPLSFGRSTFSDGQTGARPLRRSKSSRTRRRPAGSPVATSPGPAAARPEGSPTSSDGPTQAAAVSRRRKRRNTVHPTLSK